TGAHRYPEAVQSPAGAGRMISLFRLREILAWAGSPSSREDADAAPAGDTGRASAPPTPPTPPTDSEAGKEDDAGLLPARAGAADPEDRSAADGLWKELAVALAAAPEAASAAGLEETMLSARRAAWFDPDRELQKFLQKAGKQALKSSGNDFRVRYRESVASAWGADPGPVRDALRLHEDFLARALTVLDARPDAEALADTLRRMAARLHAFHADFAFLTDGAQADGIYWLEDGANPYKTTLRGVPCALEGFGDALRTLFGAGLFLSPVLLAGNHAVRDARPFLRLAGLQASPDSGIDAMPVRRLVAAAGAATAPLTVPTAPTFLMAPFAPTPRPGEEMQAYARFLLEATHPFH